MSGSNRQQWIRQCRLRLGPQEGGEGIDLSELRIKFTMTSRTASYEPNVLEAYVYNLAPATMQRIMSMPIVPVGQFGGGVTTSQPASTATGVIDTSPKTPNDQGPSQVILEAGYSSNFGVIFQGQLFQARRGRESPIDDFIILNAADGDWSHKWGFVNTTVGAGWTSEDVAKQAVLAMATYGISSGVTMPDDMPNQGAAPRGKPILSMSRDVLHDLSRSQRMDWFIENGQVQFLLYDATRPGETVVLKSNTGVTVRCLLNPAIRIGGTIQIDNASIQRQAFSAQSTGSLANTILANNLDADGVYKTISVSHMGDTRGNEWYTEVTAVAFDKAGHGSASAALSADQATLLSP
jgi:hypothetical protein